MDSGLGILARELHCLKMEDLKNSGEIQDGASGRAYLYPGVERASGPIHPSTGKTRSWAIE